MDYQDSEQFDTDSYKIDPTINEVNTDSFGDNPAAKVFQTQPILEWVSQTFYGVAGHDALIDLDKDALRKTGDAVQASDRQAKVLKKLEATNRKMVDNKVSAAKSLEVIMSDRMDGARSIMDTVKNVFLAGANFKGDHRVIQAQTQYGMQRIQAQTASNLIVERAKFLQGLAQIKVNHDNKLTDAIKTEDDTQHALRAQIFRQLNGDYVKHLNALSQYGTPVQDALSMPAKPVYDTVRPQGGAVGQFNTMMRNAAGVFRRSLGL